MSLRAPAGGLLRIAHRGAAALAPENSIAAIQAGLEHRVDFVEVDVLLTRTGDVRLAHSEAELRLDSPTLDEALGFFAAEAPAGIGIDLDLKSRGCERAAVEGLLSHGLRERALMTSFFPSSLRTVRRLEPSLRAGLSYPNDRYGLSATRAAAPFVRPGLAVLRRALGPRIGRLLARAQVDNAMLHYDLITPALVTRCHRLGAGVFAWTVETPAQLARMVAAGVDGVIANDPGLFDD